jgi:hypothetical protein
MLKVMRMDLIMNRNAMLVNMCTSGAFLLYMTWRGPTSPVTFAVFGSLMVSMLPAIIVTREDKFKAMGLGCSLPVARRTIVLARYALSLGLAGMGLAVAMNLGAWMPNSVMSPELLFRQGPLLAGVSVSVLLIALVLPFTLRFGLLGLMLALVGFQVMGIILFTVVQLTGSSADHALAERIIGGIAALYSRLGAFGFDILLLGALLALLAASLAVSVRVFQLREF